MSTISRVQGRISRDKIENEYKGYEEEEQCSFRVGRSCTDNLFCLKQVIEKKLERNRATHLIFLDLHQAYDNIPIVKLWKVFQDTNINHILIRAVQNLYDMTSTIKVENRVSEPFRVNKGL